MTVRKALPKDIDALLRLLGQVLAVHAEIRPDLFIPGTVKYTREELAGLLPDDARPVYVAVNSADEALGYVFCAVKEPPASHTAYPRKTLYIDDLCVDEACRGQGVGETLFRFAAAEAKRLGCDDVTLHVWAGNDGARRFYEKMGMTPRETTMEYPLSVCSARRTAN